MLAGVCGGLAEYLGVDPVWVRLGTVLSTLVWGLGLILYAILWITLPEQAEEEGGPEGSAMASENPRAVAGVLLLVLGLLILVWKILSLLTFKVVVPVIFIGVGLFLLLHRRQ